MRVGARAIPSTREDVDSHVDALGRGALLELEFTRVVASTPQRASEPWRTPQRAEVEEGVEGEERRAEEGTRVKEGDG